MKVIASVFIFAALAVAQTPTPATLAPSTSERLALQAVKMELQQARADAVSLDQDIRASHPGYHLDFNSLQIVKDAAAPAKPVASPAPTKK